MWVGMLGIELTTWWSSVSLPPSHSQHFISFFFFLPVVKTKSPTHLGFGMKNKLDFKQVFQARKSLFIPSLDF